MYYMSKTKHCVSSKLGLPGLCSKSEEVKMTPGWHMLETSKAETMREYIMNN